MMPGTEDTTVSDDRWESRVWEAAFEMAHKDPCLLYLCRYIAPSHID